MFLKGRGEIYKIKKLKIACCVIRLPHCSSSNYIGQIMVAAESGHSHQRATDLLKLMDWIMFSIIIKGLLGAFTAKLFYAFKITPLKLKSCNYTTMHMYSFKDTGNPVQTSPNSGCIHITTHSASSVLPLLIFEASFTQLATTHIDPVIS